MNYLYIVGTPIGNLEDITLRALAVLNSVDCILCEDTRTTKVLLDKYNISKKTLSYHSHSSLSKVTEIVDLLRNGKNLAMILIKTSQRSVETLELSFKTQVLI
jgi:16S rRNA (cytidine1402-2'-O)-methyltransferase